MKSYVTWILTWHEILRDVKSYVGDHVTSYVLDHAAGASDPDCIHDSMLGAACIRIAARIHDEPLDYT